MAYRFRKGRGQFTAPESRSGKSYIHDRRVLLRPCAFQINWNGPAFVAQVLNNLQFAFQQISDDALEYMRDKVPVDTGALRDSCFVNINVVGSRIQLQIGATEHYAVYVELGTSSHAARPYIRPTYDYVLSVLPSVIRNEVSRRGS